MRDGTPLPAENAERLTQVFDNAPYSLLLGSRVEELRRDYARVRLPYRPELDQPEGVVHGGALASVLDSAAALAILAGLDQRPKRIATISFHVQYLQAVRQEDVIVEGQIRRRGRSVIFTAAEAKTVSGRVVACGELSFFVEL